MYHLFLQKKWKKLFKELITVKFLLDSNDLSTQDRNDLQKHFETLIKEFRKELNHNNPSEMAMLKKYFQDNNEIDK